MRTITIIDYGMGNLGSLTNAFRYLGVKVLYLDKIVKSNVAILPGVGSFNKAMKIIKKNSIDDAIKSFISKRRLFDVYLSWDAAFSVREF